MSSRDAPSSPARRARMDSRPPSAPRPGSIPGAVRASPRERDSRPDRPPASAVARPGPLAVGLSLAFRAADGYLALALFAYAELYAVGFLSLRQLAGPFELSLATRGLGPVALAAAAPLGAAGGVLVEVLLRAARPVGRALAALAAGAFLGAVGYGVASGRHFEGGLRVPFAVLLGLGGAAAAFALGPRAARGLEGAREAMARRRTGAAGLFTLGVLAAAVALEVANALVLPRLYPAFHAGLAALTVLVVALGGLAFAALDAPPRPGSLVDGKLVRIGLALAVFALGSATAQGAAQKLRRADNVRLVYLERAPLGGRVVELAALLAPPEPLDDAAPLEARPGGGRAIDLRGRDVLLVTVDALRADHVGAYGYARPTTPNLDRLAAEGVVFDAAYSPTPHTSYAVTSIMTGKYMRPLVLQGLGADSETWAEHLRRYGYRTAAFYPPAVFFIDAERFVPFRDRFLDFEYRRVEFAPAPARAEAVRRYLDASPADRNVFLWVHLFEPHEPYESHPDHAFGDRDVDRYDGEIAAADEGLGAIVAAVRAKRPGAVVIVTADHGEEFSEHGGRYHGTTVYEEQVRVPLVVSAPGLFAPRRVSAPVQLVDLLPTVLSGLDIPRPARLRGADLGPLLAGAPPPPPTGPRPGSVDLPGFAFAETESQTMLARGPLRLVCARKIAACALYDVARDPGELVDVSADKPGELAAMRAELRAVEASHGRYERQGLRSEGKSLPEALRRGLAGDGDAAVDVAALLDDADVVIRRKAAEVLFELGRADVSAPLRLSLVRDEDDEVRRWCALALTRIGEGAPRTRELVADPDPRWRRLAALALGEAGDPRGEDILVTWFREAYPPKPDKKDVPPPQPKGVIPFERAREIVAALGKIRAKSALGTLLAALDDVRLRPHVARALAQIGEEAARPALAEHLKGERYQVARGAIAEALVKLGAGPELRGPLVRFLGTPDPLPEGIRLAMDAGILELVGGPRERDLPRLRRFATSGVAIGMIVPKLLRGEGGDPSAPPGKGLRVLCRARTSDGRAGEIRVGMRAGLPPAKRDHDSLVPAAAPELDPARTSILSVPPGAAAAEAFATLPPTVTLRPGDYGDFVVYATQNVQIQACVVVPLADELPPPPPEPWSPDDDGGIGAQPGQSMRAGKPALDPGGAPIVDAGAPPP